MMIAERPEQGTSKAGRLYSVCFFDRSWTVPQVQFLEADGDKEAVVLANSMKPWMEREIWERHRLVRVLRPTCLRQKGSDGQ